LFPVGGDPIDHLIELGCHLLFEIGFDSIHLEGVHLGTDGTSRFRSDKVLGKVLL